ncbi:MAG TPA: phosphoglyceromutase [Acidimicrobiia bacterium]|jgi:2,3-bisphosphoglycerate-dependent phosphoglycerate mutase
MPEATLVLLRHGQSEWNELNLFTGWVDVDLTELGRTEAVAGGEQLRAAGLRPDVLHTSVQLRAIRTAELALDAAGRKWIPVRRSWRLNERHYGALQGKNKRETVEQYGADQVQLWRRSYDVPPEALDIDDPHSGIDERYAALPRDVLPRAECLADVAARMLPYWYDAIVPDLRAGHTVLVAAHGNSLRALAQHLDGMTRDDVVELNIPTGFPLVYELDANLQPTHPQPELGVRGRYLDPAGAERAIEGVKAQTQSPKPSA